MESRSLLITSIILASIGIISIVIPFTPLLNNRASSLESTSPYAFNLYQQWKVDFNKNYADYSEETYKLNNWLDNYDYIM
jgi:hypothetical protein